MIFIYKGFISFAISNRKIRDNALHYSLFFNKKITKIFNEKNIKRFTITPTPDFCEALVLLGADTNSGISYKLQRKTNGSSHIEFPCSLLHKGIIGVEGKKCKAEINILLEDSVLLMTPTAKAIQIAANKKYKGIK